MENKAVQKGQEVQTFIPKCHTQVMGPGGRGVVACGWQGGQEISEAAAATALDAHIASAHSEHPNPIGNVSYGPVIRK